MGIRNNLQAYNKLLPTIWRRERREKMGKRIPHSNRGQEEPGPTPGKVVNVSYQPQKSTTQEISTPESEEINQKQVLGALGHLLSGHSISLSHVGRHPASGALLHTVGDWGRSVP